MLYRELGATGLRVSLLGLGALFWGEVGPNAISHILDIAADAGINHIDTARCYSGSEANIGPALKGRRERFILATKGINRDLDTFKRDLETSLGTLETDYLDLFYMHCIGSQEDFDSVMRDGLYDHAAKLKQQGRIRHIAVSSHDLETSKALVESGLFEVIMISYNPADREAEATLLPSCAERRVGVIAMKPFGGGVLTEESAAKYNITASASVSLAFGFSNPQLASVIPGFSRTEHLQQNIATLEHFEANGYPSGAREAAIASVDGLGKDFCRGCGYCRPCAKDIDIPALMRLYSRHSIFSGCNFQQMDAIQAEYSLQTVKASSCAACGECEARCPYKLPIAETMRELAHWG